MATSQEITSLVNATNNLLTEVIGQKDRLTTVADTANQKAVEANASAMQAESAETVSTEKARIAKNEADRAKAEADKAKQITGLDTVEAAVAKALAESAQYAMTKAEFFALAEKRKSDNAGSGFLEFGKHIIQATKNPINEGLFTWEDAPNQLRIGRGDSAVASNCLSKTDMAIALVNGVHHEIYRGYTSGIGFHFPDAPDGTKTYDSATGELIDFTVGAVDHNDAVAKAFAAETATNKVITTRKDLAFLETWHEDLSVNDLINPFGNVQYGNHNYEGIELSNTLLPQGYSAFGEWDTETKGFGARWSDLTDTQKIKFLQDPLNKIYFDAETGKFIQVKYRIRVVEGCDDNPNIINLMQAQGYAVKNKSDPRLFANDDNYAAIPICLVQRLNQGAYHPAYNLFGCRSLNAINQGVSGKWYNNNIGRPTCVADCFHNATSTWQQGKVGFRVDTGYIGGNGSTGRSDQYKFFDAIYAGQVEDLRLSARKQDYSRLLEDGIRRAVSGKTRGKGKVPFTDQIFTKPRGDIQWAPSGAYLTFDGMDFGEGVYEDTPTSVMGYLIDSNGKTWELLKARQKYVYFSSKYKEDLNVPIADVTVIMHRWLSSEFDSLPWVDIIGSPENIAATFPDGVVGQWIPQIPDGTSKDWYANRKVDGTRVATLITKDNGASWVVATQTGWNESGNFANSSKAVDEVNLWIYKSHADFTKPANNDVVVGGIGSVWFGAEDSINFGNRLMPSLSGLIGKNNLDERTGYASVLKHCISSDMKLFQGSWKTTHNPIEISRGHSPACKALYTLTSKNGLLYMQYHGQELKYKEGVAEGVDPWGDVVPATPFTNAYGVVPVISGEGIKTDLNGNTVKTFCHHEMIPIGIADVGESSAATIKALEINFHAMEHIPEPLKPYYHEDDVVTGYETNFADKVDEVTGEPYQEQVQTPIIGKELNRYPAYWENSGHIDDAQIAHWDNWKGLIDRHIEDLHGEAEALFPDMSEAEVLI